jgi:ABC-type phosphate transport system substrate-binding protein
MIPASKVCLALLVGLALLLDAMRPAIAGEEVVLIVSARSTIEQLDSPQVRKLFLGLTVTQHGDHLRPVLNESDDRIKELFLQNIVSMSDSTYDRYLLRLALLQGRAQPAIYKNKNQLIDAVIADPAAVGYVWARDVARDPRLKIIRIVWHD